jgi:orotate phosphoribosyltransferase
MAYAADDVPSWGEALRLIKTHGYIHRDEPFKLPSGQLSHDYIDGRPAINTGPRLRVVSTAMIELAQHRNMNFTHVGGLTIGADPLAQGIAIVADVGWFSVRKEPKPRGAQRWIEGSRLDHRDRVVIVDDVVTTGGSIVGAYNRVIEAGANVLGIIAMVDRGEVARHVFEDPGVSYAPLITYKDIGIVPVGRE